VEKDSRFGNITFLEKMGTQAKKKSRKMIKKLTNNKTQMKMATLIILKKNKTQSFSPCRNKKNQEISQKNAKNTLNLNFTIIERIRVA